MFFYGRPINEIMPALQKITGENLGWMELVYSNAGKSGEQNRLKRLEFRNSPALGRMVGEKLAEVRQGRGRDTNRADATRWPGMPPNWPNWFPIR